MTIYLVALTSILNQIAFSGSRVAVSLLALELGADPVAVGTIIALYALCPMLLSIVIGRIADRMAPQRPMLLGCAALVAALLLPVAIPSLATLYVLAVVLGFLHQIFSIPLEATVGGIGGVEKRARNYAVITMGWSIANFLGPLVAGIAIDYLGHLRSFQVLAAIAAVPTLMLCFMPDLLPKTSIHAGATARGGVLELWRDPSLRIAITAGAIIGSAKDLFQFYMPIYGHAVGLSASAIGTILGMTAAAMFVIRAIIPLLARKFSEAQILVAAVFVSMLSFVLLPFFTGAWPLAAIAFLLGLGVGCSEPMLLALFYVLTPGGRIAEVIGLHKTVRNTMQLAVPVVFGGVSAIFGYAVVFLSNAALLAGAGYFLSRADIPTTGRHRANPPETPR